MSEDEMQLFKSQSMKEIPSAVLDTKQNYERRKSVLQLIPDAQPTSFIKHADLKSKELMNRAAKRKTMATRLAMTSRVAFSQDRIITTELMRAMAILYIGPRNKPDFETDYLLSPLRAPMELLAQFPKTYLMCGEKDPLVDDTILIAGRIREAKRHARAHRRGISMVSRDESDRDWVEMMLIRGVSHGFLQMTAFLKEGRVAVDKIGTWIEDLFSDGPVTPHPVDPQQKAIFSIQDSEEESEEDQPLEIAGSRQMSPQPSTGTPRRESPSKGSDDKRNHYRHDTWESKNVLKEHILLDRRREAITRGLEVNQGDNNEETSGS
jgi:hypothetical protein